MPQQLLDFRLKGAFFILQNDTENGTVLLLRRARAMKNRVDNCCFIQIINTGVRSIGWAIHTSNKKRLRVDPPSGVLDPWKVVFVAVSCDAFEVSSEDTNNDRVIIEWTNAPDGAAKRFRRKWFEGDNIVLRKNIPVECNLDVAEPVSPGDISIQAFKTDDEHNYHVKVFPEGGVSGHSLLLQVINEGGRRIGWAFETNNKKLMSVVDPPNGVLDPKEAVLMVVSCDDFRLDSKGTVNDHTGIAWTNAPKGANKHFRRVWFHGDNEVRRMNLPIDCNLDGAEPVFPGDISVHKNSVSRQNIAPWRV